MATTKLTLSMDPGTAQILEHVESKSGYVARLIERAAQEWRAALAYLKECGWTSGEVFAACDALNGVRLWADYGFALGARLAAELEDAGRIYDVHGKHGVDREGWGARVASLASDPEAGRALLTVVLEWWDQGAGETAIDAAVRRLE